jgi:purine-binding chemotaxis protein CheW
MRGLEVTPDRVLVGRVGGVVCALPVTQVVETMRPLPVEPLGGAPAFVRGLAIIRGAATVVVDTAALLGRSRGAASPARFVIVRAGARTIALEFTEVLDVRSLAGDRLAALPPLFSEAAAGHLAAIAAVDRELVVVLAAARVIPDTTWAAIEAAAAAKLAASERAR